jgi:hypothetical protein
MAAPTERPNFYDLLGLDPEAPWDESLYKRVLSEARSKWSRASAGIRDRPATIEAKRNLNYKIAAVMGNPKTREEERLAALRGKRDTLEERRRDLRDRLQLMTAKGHLLDTEVTAIEGEFADVLAIDTDLRRRLRQAEVRQADAKPPATMLDRSTEDNLRSLLMAAQAKTLYDVLKLGDDRVTATSPRKKLLDAAQELTVKAHHDKRKSDPRITAWERLAKLAESLFASEEMRARYDRFTTSEKVRAVVLRFERVLETAAAVTGQQMELYLEQVRTYGVGDLEMAKEYFVAYFSRRGWTVQLPTPEAEDRLARKMQCPNCAALNDPGSVACAVCAFVLNEPCPNCGLIEPRYGGGCRCGFPIGQRELVEGLVLEARTALDEHELRKAEAHLQRAARIWQLPAGRQDRVAASIQRTLTDLTDVQRGLGSLLERIEALLEARKYVAAEQLIREAPMGLPRRDILLGQAETEVRKARALCRQARNPDLTRERRTELYMEALRVCDDMEIARTELSRIPPAEPRHVVAEISDPAAGVLLSWQPSPDPDVAYVVMRGTGRQPPTSAEEMPSQRRLGSVTTTSWRDRDAAKLSGRILRYAVIADRFGTYSAAVPTAPVVVTTEAEVSADSAGSGEIVVSWILPEHAIGVQVSRQQVGDPSEPVTLKTTEPDRLLDTGVSDGVRYRYTVRVGYEDPSGGFLWSRGAADEATAVRPPSPPGRLTAQGETSALSLHKVQLRSPMPERGSIKVVRQTGAGTLREGDRCSMADLARAGHVLDGSPPVRDFWIDRSMTVCTYTPVLVVDGVGYVGPSRHYANASQVTGLTVEFSGRTVRLGWSWPAECAGVMIGYDESVAPVDPTDARGELTVYRHGDEPTGECNLPIGDAERVHVVVGTLIRQVNAEFVSTGVAMRLARPSLTVRYEVRSASLRRHELVLQVSEPAMVPALVLRARRGSPPRTRGDGFSVHELPPMRLSNRRTVPLPRQEERDLAYRLFTASAADSMAVSLEHR